ncbi:hypothetical protein GW17_00014784 [Ensete ventricosum]|nr:hypothetical protein GW17_00014784 [Ensete ventricosum]
MATPFPATCSCRRPVPGIFKHAVFLSSTARRWLRPSLPPARAVVCDADEEERRRCRSNVGSLRLASVNVESNHKLSPQVCDRRGFNVLWSLD